MSETKKKRVKEQPVVITPLEIPKNKKELEKYWSTLTIEVLNQFDEDVYAMYRRWCFKKKAKEDSQGGNKV
jgi:hypothetical protein